jgi:hypothetical protein
MAQCNIINVWGTQLILTTIITGELYSILTIIILRESITQSHNVNNNKIVGGNLNQCIRELESWVCQRSYFIKVLVDWTAFTSRQRPLYLYYLILVKDVYSEGICEGISEGISDYISDYFKDGVADVILIYISVLHLRPILEYCNRVINNTKTKYRSTSRANNFASFHPTGMILHPLGSAANSLSESIIVWWNWINMYVVEISAFFGGYFSGRNNYMLYAIRINIG